MKLELHDHQSTEHDSHYALEQINLAGNLLTGYRCLSECNLFREVRYIDLSKNLIENLTPFPFLAVMIDVSGNYFALHGHQMVGVFPRGLRKLCVSAAMPTDQCYGEFARFLILEAELWNLVELQICGVNRELPREVL